MPDNNTISWSVEPRKKSIALSVWKHPSGTKDGLTPTLPTQDTVDESLAVPATHGLEDVPQTSKREKHGKSSEETAAIGKLEGIGLRKIASGKCEAGRPTLGRHDVDAGEGGMYGLCFDNTFSKQTSKTVHFVLMTYPTSAPPKSGHHLYYSQAFAAGSTRTIGKSHSPGLRAIADSSEDLPGSVPNGGLDEARPVSKRGRSGAGGETTSGEGASFYTGVLAKKRRKKGQGYARRFFSLDFTSSTLSYYHDRHSSALRGAVPLSLAAVGVNEKTREFSIDSGAEVWHLKANSRDFDGWRKALERAASSSVITESSTPALSLGNLPRLPQPNPAEDREWQMVEELVSRVSGTRDALRGLAKDTDPKYLPGTDGAGLGLTISGGSSSAPSPASLEPSNSYFPDNAEPSGEKRPFWKRKPSSTERSPAALFRRSVAAQLAVPSPSAFPPPSLMPGSTFVNKRPSTTNGAPELADDVHERCLALLNDLDGVVSQFSHLVARSKARRKPALPTSNSRMSLETLDNEEFFDAEDGGSPSQLLSIQRDEGEEDRSEREHDLDDESDASSDTGDAAREPSVYAVTPKAAQGALFPSVPKSLPPLPLEPVKRRGTVKPPKQAPPSIIGFLRKNAGKDLSTVAMPVTANEPTSLLQRLAESLEYPQLLDNAAGGDSPAERLMYVTAFAVSHFSINRVKERALRKPFNPMLGETFELVREDLGFRFLAEKVSHHPVRLACQAESLSHGGWCFTQSPSPVQKFWGKSMELNTEGRARVALHSANEHYSWNQATCFLRNVIAGEKYVEPVQTMTIFCETTGMRAVVAFKAGGMFSGRSEDLSVQFFGSNGEQPMTLGLAGKWTESLKRTDTASTIWTVGPLVPDAPKVYGFTAFAATLNEVTANEEGHVAPTDSRLRPDQAALEQGDVDKAEALKVSFHLVL